MRRFVRADTFTDYVNDIICRFERAIRDKAYFSMVRCFDHGWHVCDSPFHETCIDRCQTGFDGQIGQEWWSRFGSYSMYVRLVVGENLYIRGIVRGYDWWHRPEGWHLTLPRYCNSPFDIARVLAAAGTIGDRPSTDPAPEWCFGATHALSSSNQRRTLSMSERAAAADMQASADLTDHGVHSKSLKLLWAQKRWATGHLIYYREAVQIIQASGQVRRHISALRKLDADCDVQNYLRQIFDPDIAVEGQGHQLDANHQD